MLINLHERIQQYPVWTGTVMGASIGVLVALSIATISLLLYQTDAANHASGGAGYGLLIGFVILPLTFVVSAPWSFIGLMFVHAQAAGGIIGSVLGLIINGPICGRTVGKRAKARGRIDV
jgi:hypothetical protein